MELNDSYVQSLSVESTSGDVDLERSTAAGAVEISTVSGEISLERSDAASLTLSTTSGEIEGSLLSAKNFSVTSTHGRVQVPDSDPTSRGLHHLHHHRQRLDLHSSVTLHHAPARRQLLRAFYVSGGTLMHTVYFTRHGQTVWNVENKICGVTDSPLTDLGRSQARALGRQLADDGHGITHILCSPLSRAHETAQIIAAETGLP